MSKAEDHPNPRSYLDKAVVRLALRHMRELIARGHSPADAATLSCPGAWAEFREYVLTQLIQPR